MRATLAPARPAEPGSGVSQIRLAIGLIGVIWAAGLVGHFTPLGEWPALFI